MLKSLLPVQGLLRQAGKKISQRLSSGARPKKNIENRLKPGQIIALGGGGFSDEPGNPLLDEYILKQSGKSVPKILFLPTAGGDHEDYIAKFYRAYKKLSCKPSHISLTRQKFTYSRLESLVLSQDIIFVGGGSPRFLMQVWRKTGMDKLMKKAWQQGIILSGMSAGAICWFEDGFKNPKDNIWLRISCLGFLEGSFCPHYDKRSELRLAYRKMISEAEISDGYGVQDGVALHFIGTELKHIVSSNQTARAFYVRKAGIRVTEKELKPEYLGFSDSKSESKSEFKTESKIKSEFETKLRDDTKFVPDAQNPETSVKLVQQYIEKINNHDIDGMAKMVSDDSEFIDSLGINTVGRENMRKAWEVLLTFFPDYHVNIKDVISKNGTVALFGTAKGTLATNGVILDENKFEIPASWTAVVRDGKIAKWRVYADNQNVRKLIEKYQKYAFK
jgi:dipeptidase E